MIDHTTQLILDVGNVIHDDVCMALSRVNFKELEDAPHSDRVDAAAAKIIAMIEQDVARRLLSDEAVEAGAIEIWQDAPVGVAIPGTRWESMKAWVQDGFRQKATEVHRAALATIGIDVEKLS